MSVRTERTRVIECSGVVFCCCVFCVGTGSGALELALWRSWAHTPKVVGSRPTSAIFIHAQHVFFASLIAGSNVVWLFDGCWFGG